MREELQENIKRFVNFMNFARSFFQRKNPFKALIISFAVGRIGLINRHRIKFVKNCVATEAIAAPAAPMSGIKIKFPTTFKTAPDKLIIHKYNVI